MPLLWYLSIIGAHQLRFYTYVTGSRQFLMWVMSFEKKVIQTQLPLHLRGSHINTTLDNLANSTTWQQTALQSANSTTYTNTLSEITVDRYSNIHGNIWLNIDRYVILALYARSRITWRRRVLSYPYTTRWIAGVRSVVKLDLPKILLVSNWPKYMSWTIQSLKEQHAII